MPSDPASDEDDLEPFHRWLSSTAAAEGISRAELVDEMLSYYWIVNELSKTVGDSGDASGIATAPEDVSLDNLHADPNSSGDSRPASGEEAPPEHGTGDDATEPADRSPEETPPRELLAELLENVDQLERLVESVREVESERDSANDPPEQAAKDGSEPAGEHSESSAPSAATKPPETNEAIEALLAVEDRLEDLRTRQETAFQTVGAAVAGLERRQERIANRAVDGEDLSEVADIQAALVEELERVEAQLQALEGRSEAIGDRHERLATDLETLQSSHERLEDRIEAEFDDLESILTHLLETVRDLDTAVDEAKGRHDGDIEMFKYQLQKRQHLQELKRTANLEGIETADCANCGQTVRLGLLETPFCPECGEQFARVEATWVPFRNATIENGGPLKR